MVREQYEEAIRASDPTTAPYLPATYEYLKRLDRDIGLFGDPD